MEKKNGAEQSTLGNLTYTDLADTDAFLRPEEKDAWGVLRVPFSPHIARLSAELAADGYSLDIKPWMQAGWDDCTFVIEDKVVALDKESESRLSAVESEWKRRRARSLIHGVNPVNDLKRAIRQIMVTDLGKAIVMTRRTADGGVLVAISFIGTTQKYFDWFSNFKFQRDTGMHYGFLELAKNFDAQSTRILLPKLAAALGEESLTLADVVIEAKKPENKVRFWISGHSQGGAIAQTYTHLLMEQGISSHCIQAYTYAAPSVAAVDGELDVKQYPVYNIINADDLVPRVGAQLRLGMDMVFLPKDSFRKKHYRVEEDMQEATDRFRYMADGVQTTGEAITWGIAFMQLMVEMEAEGELDSLFTDMIPHAAVLLKINLSIPEIVEYLIEKMQVQLKKLTGSEVESGLCTAYKDSLRTMLADFGGKAASKAIMHGFGMAHGMRPDKHDEAYESPYIGIARRHLAECEQGIWLNQLPPQCVDSDDQVLLPTRHMGGKALPPAGQPLLGEGAATEDNQSQEEKT